MSERNKQIKMARAQSGIKGKDLAKRLNISAAYLSQLENGMRAANDELFKRIIKETGFDANLLNFRDIHVIENHGSVGLPGAKLNIHSLNETTSMPRWAEELCSDVSFLKSSMAKLRDQLADIHALLVKLSAK